MFQKILFVLNAQSANGFRGRFVFISLLPLLVGGSIYLFLRPGEFVFHSWMSAVGLEGLFGHFGRQAPFQGGHLADWILYSLPNGLWAFAYASLITLLWAASRSPARYFWFATIPLLVLGFEGLQGLGIIPGTYSITDLLFGIAGLVLGFSMSVFIQIKNNHEKTLE